MILVYTVILGLAKYYLNRYKLFPFYGGPLEIFLANIRDFFKNLQIYYNSWLLFIECATNVALFMIVKVCAGIQFHFPYLRSLPMLVTLGKIIFIYVGYIEHFSEKYLST